MIALSRYLVEKSSNIETEFPILLIALFLLPWKVTISIIKSMYMRPPLADMTSADCDRNQEGEQVQLY